MRPFARRSALLLALLALAGGCQRLHHEQTLSLGMAESQSIPVDAPRYNQQVAVTVTPTGGPVSAYLVKTDEVDRVITLLDGGKAPPADAVFASKESKDRPEEYVLEGTVPANTAFSVLLRTHLKKADVKVKIVGR
jgi:hypothetical protein